MPKKPAAKGRPKKRPPPGGAPIKKAPEPWLGERASGEKAPDFFRRVWGRYIALGLTENQLRKLDKRMAQTINWYGRRGKHRWPADLTLPNNRTRVTRHLAMIEEGRWSELSDWETIQALRKRIRARKKAADRG